MQFFKSLYLHQRFFTAIFGIAVIFLFSHWINFLYPIGWLAAVLLFLAFLIDIIAVFKNEKIVAKRKLPEKFSNSDENPVVISIKNNFGFKIYVEVIDELPVQFQKRDFLKQLSILPNETNRFEYLVRPVERGEYFFGNLNVYVSSKIKLVKRRFSFQKEQMVKVYPSFIQMKKYDFLAIDNRIQLAGLKKIRKIGQTMEFEQIKDYVIGDDLRTVNWKATAKQGSLMTNQYQDEKSQSVYTIIDTSRVMKMPFNGLRLLDYAINSTLAFSNIALKKHDKVGMFSFSNKIDKALPASSKKTHLQLILNSLYNVKTQFLDSDFGLLYAHIKRRVPQRSLLILFTNFEHISALERQFVYLRALAKKHVLVVVFFENSELEKIIDQEEIKSVSQVFEQTVAEQFSYEKKLMVKELQRHGIQTVLTSPEELSINTINKYLQIKAKGLL
ncbi:MAG TPA: DUF58 domain-containing protein [Salinimicrobium sp.]|nr:DUF58 domain-containing protein [Salinimicrobium sp.]